MTRPYRLGTVHSVPSLGAGPAGGKLLKRDHTFSRISSSRVLVAPLVCWLVGSMMAPGGLSQDILSSLFPIGSLSKYYYIDCATSNVYGTPVSTTVDTVATIVFSNTVRSKRSKDRHRMTPTGVLRTALTYKQCRI